MIAFIDVLKYGGNMNYKNLLLVFLLMMSFNSIAYQQRNLKFNSLGWFGRCDWTQNNLIVGLSLNSNILHCAQMIQESECKVYISSLAIFRNECLWNLNEVAVFKKDQFMECHRLEVENGMHSCQLRLINPNYKNIDCDYSNGEVLLSGYSDSVVRCASVVLDHNSTSRN